MDKTTRSIADNMIDPTNYSHGGGVEENKLGFENIPEDWVMYVQLFVKSRNRSVLLKNADNSIAASDQQEYLVAEIPYYDKIINKNSSGDIIPFDIQTTEYTDLFGAKGLPTSYDGTPTTLGQESSFGITSIDIDFSDVRHPNFEITFVDVRGAGLASFGPTCGLTKSPYSWFFLLPYPEFCLKVKGYFGKTISIPMQLYKFDMKFNNTTGNFDIVAKFVGYPFSILNDINIKFLERLCCIPGGPEELENVYNKLKRCLNPNNPDELIILREMPKIEDLCIKEYIRAIESGKIDNPIQESYSVATAPGDMLVVKHNNIMTEFNKVITAVRANDGRVYNGFTSLLLQIKNLENEFQRLYSTPSIDRGLGGAGGDKLVLRDKSDNTVAFLIENFEDYIKFNKIPVSKFNPITIETSNAYFDPCSSEGGNITAERTFKDGVNSILSDNETDTAKISKTIKEFITKETFTSAMNSGSVINAVEKCLLMLREQYQERLKYINNYQYYLCNYYQRIEKKIQKEFTETVRVRPTLQRIITLIAINAEAFLNLLLKTSIRAERYHEANKEKALYTNYFTDASNQQFVNKKNESNNGSVRLRDVKLYAWPKTYKFDGDGAKIECFPTELNDGFSEWPEVKFTKTMIDAIASNNCRHDKLTQTTGDNPGIWKPLNIFEDSPFTKNQPLNSTSSIDSPYNNKLIQNYLATEDGVNSQVSVREEKLKQIIVSRALANIFYFNRLFDQNADISNDSKRAMIDGYVKLLAQRDVDNLISTLEQCNLIETVSNSLAGDSGLQKLNDYVASSSAQLASNGQKFTLKPDLELPYEGVFYLGNNMINSRVDGEGQTYYRPRTDNENFKQFYLNNYYGLSFYDQPQYPFVRYATVYLEIPGFGPSIISGYEYDVNYKNTILQVSNVQDVIFNYCPWFNHLGTSTNTPPLGIVNSTIANPEYSRNVYYNKSHVVKIVTYDPFLNPSHIRDITTFNLHDRSKLPKDSLFSTTSLDDKNPVYEFGNGIPSWNNLFSMLIPQVLQHGRLPVGISAFREYKYISQTKNAEDAIFMGGYHPINFYETDKSYYYGADPLIKTFSNTNRTYHTTYNYYLSDTLKSFLWDPYKTKIGNSRIQLGSQEKSAYNIVTNINNPELKKCNVTTVGGKLEQIYTSSVNNELNAESSFGSNWGVPDYPKYRNTGFQNTIFYSAYKLIRYKHVRNEYLPIYTCYQENSNLGADLSLMQYLFVGEKTQNTNSAIPENSFWIRGFGENETLGFDGVNPYTTFTMKELFGGVSPLNQPGKYFLDYVSLTSDANKGLDINSFYDIPTDMNSTWFQAKIREYNKKITPVKKYSTITAKRLSYLIWQEAASRILSMCEINFGNDQSGISESPYYSANYSAYTTVYLVDDPTKRPGGPTTATTESLFDDTYPQHKFINQNINIYENVSQYGFYNFKDDGTGTYIIGSNSSETFNGSITPGPNGTNAFFPNDNPTDSFVAGTSLTYTQPPLLTKAESNYSGAVTKTPKWSRLFIHQTEWWKNMTSDPRLSNDFDIRAMKTYLTVMSLWGGNSMDALLYNYPLLSPTNGLFRVNNIDLVTLGAQLWAADTSRTLSNGVDTPFNVITDHYIFNCSTYNQSLTLRFGIPTEQFPFNVVLKDTTYELESFNRYDDYGFICKPNGLISSQNNGESDLTPGTAYGTEQKWRVSWDLKGTNYSPLEITLKMFSDDVKRDLINHFLAFVETSDFSRNIDNNLNALSMLREIAELALNSVENSYSIESDFHRFPFDLEQSLLLWGDWASIVDLNASTRDFKSYYDFDDGFRVKRPEQKTILSSKFFDVLTIESDGGHLDNPFKSVKEYIIDSETYFYSPWIRIGDELLMLKGDIGKRVIMKLLKVITLEEQTNSVIPIIEKRGGKYETTLNYKQKGRGKTLPGNDQNYFFEFLFKGFYFPTIYGGMKTTDSSEYDYNSLGAQKLFFTKSWQELNIPGWSSSDERINMINDIASYEKLNTYFKVFCDGLNTIKTKNSNYEKCKGENKANVSQNYNVDIGADSLLMYRSLRNLFNRWLAGTTEDDHTWKRSGCASVIESGDVCRSLVQNIFIVDRVNRPAGDKVCIKPEYVSDFFNTDNDKTVMTFLSDMVSSESGGVGGFIMEYPTFFNFGNSGVNIEPNPGQSMWGMSNSVDEKYGGPAMVIYVQKSDQSTSNSIINDYVNEDGGCAGSNALPSDFNSPDSRGVLFKVAIGNENNNIFTNLQIGSEEFKETWEHIQVLTQMANEINTGVPKFMDQNLYNLWLTRSFTASLECFGNMMIQPGMYFYLENVPIFGGTYIIKKVKHTIEVHKIKTRFWGTRVNMIPYPYINKGPVGSYYGCENNTIIEIPEVINNDPGYCKETMLEVLESFVDEINLVLGIKPLVYTTDEFLTSLGFTEDDSKNFYDSYDVVIDNTDNDKPFNNLKSVSITQESFTDRSYEEMVMQPMPQSDVISIQTEPWVAAATGYVYPIEGNVSSGFGNRIHPTHGDVRFHNGIDIANVVGTPVYAVYNGVIQEMTSPIINYDLNGGNDGWGNRIVIRHTLPNGEIYITTYNHLRKGTPFASGLAVGQTVTTNQLIGYVGNTGIGTGPHLHFSMHRGTDYRTNKIDPTEIFKRWDVPNTTYVKRIE